jgi:cysteine synthase B
MAVAISDTRTLQLKTVDTDGLEARVGNTPLIRLHRVTAGLRSAVRILAKAEWFNPSGSVKDRAAINIIRTGIADGQLGGGRRLLDSTSGNMGIAYATFGAAMGVPVTLCVPQNASPERLSILRSLGAEVIQTDPAEGSDGALVKARALAKESPDLYWYANQYNNSANWQAHFMTTGPEVLEQTRGRVTHLVAGLGTSGTLMGAGRYLKEHSSSVELVAVQPDSAFHGLEGLKHMPSALRPGIYVPTLVDRNLGVATEAAHEMVRRLAREEGLFVGISSGAAAVAALEVAAELRDGCIVAVFPDAGYKYLSDRVLWTST